MPNRHSSLDTSLLSPPSFLKWSVLATASAMAQIFNPAVLRPFQPTSDIGQHRSNESIFVCIDVEDDVSRALNYSHLNRFSTHALCVGNLEPSKACNSLSKWNHGYDNSVQCCTCWESKVFFILIMSWCIRSSAILKTSLFVHCTSDLCNENGHELLVVRSIFTRVVSAALVLVMICPCLHWLSRTSIYHMASSI